MEGADARFCWRHEGCAAVLGFRKCHIVCVMLKVPSNVKVYRGVDAWLQAVLTSAVGDSGNPYASHAQPVNIFFSVSRISRPSLSASPGHVTADPANSSPNCLVACLLMLATETRL
jgi:hypothetical protein